MNPAQLCHVAHVTDHVSSPDALPPNADVAEDSWVAQAEDGSGVMTSEQLSDSVMIASSVLSALGAQVSALGPNP